MSETVSAFLARQGAKFRIENGKNGREVVFDCPVCGAEGKANANDRSWLWQCFKCGKKAKEFLLLKAYGAAYDFAPKRGQARDETIEDVKTRQLAAALAKRASTPVGFAEAAHKALWTPRGAEALAYLRSRGLDDSTIRIGLLGWTPTRPKEDGSATALRLSATPEAITNGKGWIVIPFYGEWEEDGTPKKGATPLIKFRNADPNADKKDRYRRTKGADTLLYTPIPLEEGARVVLVGGELDALSAIQLGVKNVAATAGGEKALSPLAIEALDSASEIVIVYDNDDAGREGATLASKTLGRHRTAIGELPKAFNDWNAALQAGEAAFDIISAHTVINNAKSCGGEGVAALADARQAFVSRLRGATSASQGVPTGIASLDALIGGLRDAEFSYWSGGSGSGKSTIVSQIALARAKAGDGVLFAPLEIGLTRAYGKLTRQLGLAPPEILDADGTLEAVLDELDELPIWTLYRNKIEPEALRGTISYAARKLGVRLVVIDHLHWIATGDPEKERGILDQLVKELHDVAIAESIHVMAVGHPKKLSIQGKDRDNAVVQNEDAKGSSSIIQAADLVVNLWRPRVADRSTVLDENGVGAALAVVTKARAENSREGSVALQFVPDAATFYDESVVLQFDAVGI